jgi:hypothetical protein
MSGKKRITVGEAEWNALQQQARQLRDLQRNAPKLVADLRRQTQADLDEVSRRLEGRQSAVEQRMGALSTQAKQLEAETSRRLTEQAAQLHSRLSQTAGQLRAETDAALAEQQRTWRAELATERDKQRAEVSELRNELRGEAQASAEAAQAWLSDAAVLRDVIGNQLPHERYAPGELAALTRRLTTAEESSRQGQSQAALALAQQLYHDLHELRVEIELRDREWTGRNTVITEGLRELDETAASNAVLRIAPGEFGNDAAVELDVDHWSEGGLSELRADLRDLLARINDAENPPTAEQLQRTIDTLLPELEQRLTGTLQRARLRLLASQRRINVADVVVQTLDRIGNYYVEDHAYERMDQRRAFFAKLGNFSGNEIVLSVAAAADDSGECVVRVLSYDYDTASQEILDERGDAIIQELRSHGLTVEDNGCEAGEPERVDLDFERLRQPGPADEGAPAQAPGARAATS